MIDDTGVSRLEHSQELNWNVQCPYGNCEFGPLGLPHSISTTNMHIATAHKSNFMIHGIPVKPEITVRFASGEVATYYQCGICGGFTTVRYTRHYAEHFSRDVNSKIQFGSLPLTFHLNNRKKKPMNVINLDCFLRQYFDFSLPVLHNRFKDSNLPIDLKANFLFNSAGVERAEGPTRFYVFIDPIRRIGYIGSTKQFWRIRRNSYTDNVYDLAFGDGTVFTIIGYVDRQRNVLQWASKKEFIEFFLLNLLSGRNGYTFLNGRYNLNVR